MSSSSNVIVDATTEASETPPVAISRVEWKIVADILRQHLAGREIWADGSRARRTRLKKYSDLDLAVEGPPLSFAVRSDLTEAFEESDLPFKVDIVETESLDPEFRRRIEADKVILTKLE
jgi:type I restriction enzyme S subunit